MNYDQEHFLKAVQSPSGMKRLAAVLSTLSVEEIRTFASEISEDLGKLIYNDEKAEAERVRILVAGIASYATDPSWEEAD